MPGAVTCTFQKACACFSVSVRPLKVCFIIAAEKLWKLVDCARKETFYAAHVLVLLVPFFYYNLLVMRYYVLNCPICTKFVLLRVFRFTLKLLSDFFLSNMLIIILIADVSE